MLTLKNLESLNFVFVQKDGNKSVFQNNCEFNRDEKIHFGEVYKDRRYIAIENNCGQFYFMGWLKTKKELKKILEQVGIGFRDSNQADA